MTHTSATAKVNFLAALAFLPVLVLLAGKASAAPPPAIDVVAPFPGASVEEVERQVTVPLEVALAGMRGLEHLRTQSKFGQSLVRVHFKKNIELASARQQVINRLQTLQTLPVGVVPQVAAVPAGVLVRYTLSNPRNADGSPHYTIGDLTTLQDWVLEREFRRVPRVVDAVGFGGATRRYEIYPDPDRLKRYGITLQQLESTIAKGNTDVGGDLLGPGGDPLVRSVRLLGGGRNPLGEAMGKKNPRAAAAHLRAEEARRLSEIRQLVIAEVKNVPILVEDAVEGGRLKGDDPSRQGVIVGQQPSRGRVGFSGTHTDEKERVLWEDEDDRVAGAVMLRQGEDARIALADVKAKIKELNETAGRLLPGVRIEIHDEGADLGLPGNSGHTWIQGYLPGNTRLDQARSMAGKVRELLRGHAEVKTVVSMVGGTENESVPDRFNRVAFIVAFKPRKDWPEALRQELSGKLAGVDWTFSATCRDGFTEAFTAAPGEGMLKIHGHDLEQLQLLAEKARQVLAGLAGVDGVRTLSLAGPEQLDFRVDVTRCAKLGIRTIEVNRTIAMALDGKPISQMVEGERLSSIVLRWRTRDASGILDLPVDPGADAPRLRLRDLVTPLDKEGKPDPKGHFPRAGVAVIYREDGKRMIAVSYGFRGQDENTIRAEAKKKIEHLFKAPYRAEWGDR